MFGCADEYVTPAEMAHHYLSSAHTTAELKAFGMCRSRLLREYKPPIDTAFTDVTPIGDFLDEIPVEIYGQYETEVSIAIAMADPDPTSPPRFDLNNAPNIAWHDEGG